MTAALWMTSSLLAFLKDTLQTINLPLGQGNPPTCDSGHAGANETKSHRRRSCLFVFGIFLAEEVHSQQISLPQSTLGFLDMHSK